jgi:hypothetical protein
MELPETKRNAKTADKVNKILAQCSSLGIETTRRQARKMLRGCGGLTAKIKAAEGAR